MDNRVFEPEIELEHDQRGQLAQTTATEGFRVLQRIMRSTVDSFLLDLINANAANQSEVLSRHNLAKAAAQFYQRVTNTVNEEVRLYVAAPRATDTPVDLTEHTLDLGALASRYADIEHDLEEGHLNEY